MTKEKIWQSFMIGFDFKLFSKYRTKRCSICVDFFFFSKEFMAIWDCYKRDG